MTLLQQIQTDLVAAMRAKDEARLSALRMVKTALDRVEKDQRKPLDPAGEQKVLGTLVKQRRDSIDMFTKGNRPELAAKEQAELVLIESYMPKEATEAEVDAVIEAVLRDYNAGIRAIGYEVGPIAKKMGVFIKEVQSKLVPKRVDGRMLSDKLKAKLA